MTTLFCLSISSSTELICDNSTQCMVHIGNVAVQTMCLYCNVSVWSAPQIKHYAQENCLELSSETSRRINYVKLVNATEMQKTTRSQYHLVCNVSIIMIHRITICSAVHHKLHQYVQKLLHQVGVFVIIKLFVIFN